MNPKLNVQVKTEIVKDPEAKVVEIPMVAWKKLKANMRKQIERESVENDKNKP